MKPETLKKLLQAGALATDAMSRGSAGGLGAAIVNSKIDLSGQNPFNSQKTSNASGGDLTEFQKRKKEILNPTAPDPLGGGRTDYNV